MPEPFRILVTGARVVTTACEDIVIRALNRVSTGPHNAGRSIVVVEGACPSGGVDLVAHRWARVFGIPERHPADWKRYGKAAGPRRNAEMVALGAHICLAFPDDESNGTWDCLRKAANAGIVGHVYPLGSRAPRPVQHG